MALHIRQ